MNSDAFQRHTTQHIGKTAGQHKFGCPAMPWILCTVQEVRKVHVKMHHNIPQCNMPMHTNTVRTSFKGLRSVSIRLVSHQHSAYSYQPLAVLAPSLS